MDDPRPSHESHSLPEEDLYELSFDVEPAAWRPDLRQEVVESARERHALQRTLKAQTRALALRLEELAEQLSGEDRETRQRVLRTLYWTRHEVPVVLLLQAFGIGSEDRLAKRAGPLKLRIRCSACGRPIQPRYRRRLRAVLAAAASGPAPRCYTCWHERTVGKSTTIDYDAPF